MENEQKKERSRIEMQELALLGLVRAKKARLHNVTLYLTGTIKGEVEQKPFSFYKLDCPQPNVRRDGSVWPSPPGFVDIRNGENAQRSKIPQEEIK